MDDREWAVEILRAPSCPIEYLVEHFAAVRAPLEQRIKELELTMAVVRNDQRMAREAELEAKREWESCCDRERANFEEVKLLRVDLASANESLDQLADLYQEKCDRLATLTGALRGVAREIEAIGRDSIFGHGRISLEWRMATEASLMSVKEKCDAALVVEPNAST